MLQLLAPRVVQRSTRRHTYLGLNETIIAASAKMITQALEGGKQLPRTTLYTLWEQAGISTDASRGVQILDRLAHDRVLCFGVRAGNQPTFALLKEWVLSAKSLPRDEALATLALHYFTGHGPATVQDFVWWSGLTTREANAGLAAVAAQLGRERICTHDYYFARDLQNASTGTLDSFLLPPFDEFLLRYHDCSAVLDPQHNTRVVPGGNGDFNPITVIGCRVAGTRKRIFKKDNVVLTFIPFTTFTEAHSIAIAAAAQRYADFIGKRTLVELS